MNTVRNNQGAALLMILGVIATLAILLTASLSIIGMRIKIIDRKSDMFKSKMITKSVQVFSGYVLMTDSNEYDSVDDVWADSPELFTGDYDENSSWAIIGKISDTSVTNFGFIDEERKLNVRKATFGVLVRLLENSAGLDTQDAYIVAAGIEQARIDNMINYSNSFQTVYELLYIPEMNSEIFDSIRDSITIYGNGKVNINTVDKNVLMALATEDGDQKTSEAFVEKLLLFRNQGNIIKAKNGNKMKTAISEAIPLSKEEKTILDNIYTNLTSKSNFYQGNLEINIDEYSEKNIFIINKKNGKVISSLTLIDDEL
ncbi:MAG: type II secretion system protein GspK [Kiritimatiellae bacterium]|jgi:type II secretory pathway component PulK|nr:type II secretion system protein GspK [Kiritimatiellia bacterium]